MEKSNQKISKRLSNGEVTRFKGMLWQSSVFKTLLTGVVFFVLGFLIYSTTLESPFVFDDVERILENADIRMNELTAKNILSAGSGKKSAKSRPVGNISFALNYYFHQYKLRGYHIVNIIIHVLTGIFLYSFIKSTLTLPSVISKRYRPDTIALFAAIIWFVNPIQTQSVVYIVQRLNSLSAMFFILSFLFYLKGRLAEGKAKRWAWFFGAGFGWILALGCKQNAATLPFFIFLYEWYFFQDLKIDWLKRNLKYIILIVLIFCLVSFLYLGFNPAERISGIKDYAHRDFTISERVMTQFRVVIYYLSLAFFPHPSRLNLDYDFALSYSLMNPFTTLLSLTAIIGLIILGVYLAKKERLISFCILWFFGNLVIESSVIPLALIFEHRLYLPSMLLFLIPVILGYRYIKLNWLRAGLLCLVVAVFSVWTYQRNRVWENDLSLWTDVVKKSPNKARPQLNLGLALENRDRLDEAIHHYQKSLQMDPNYVEALNNLGVVLEKQGKINDAEQYYRKALEIKPNHISALNNLGNALSKEGKANEAIEHFRRALQLDPDNDKAHNNLGLVLVKQGKTNEAVGHYRKALQVNPNNAEGHNNLGGALLKQGKTDEARQHFTAALRLDPDLSEAHNNMGIMLEKQGKPNQALEHFRKALELNPDNDEAHNNLGLVLLEQGKAHEAVGHYRRALQINPNYAEAHNNLGGELLMQGKADEAREHFSAALSLDPNLAHAHSNMGALLLQTGQIEAAIPYFREALRINPDFSLADANLKRALAIQKNVKEKTAMIQAALNNNPDDPLLYFEMGNIFLGQGEFRKAIRQFEKALSIQPQFAPAQYNLALAYAAGKQYDKALKAFKKMAALHPDNANTYYNIAAMYALQNSVQESIAWLKKAIDKGYNNWELIKTDKDLENIRNSADFKELIKNH